MKIWYLHEKKQQGFSQKGRMCVFALNGILVEVHSIESTGWKETHLSSQIVLLEYSLPDNQGCFFTHHVMDSLEDYFQVFILCVDI